MLTLRQLDHVLAITDHRSFHRAAEALALTPSALTQSIQKLEADLGVVLFERGKRDVAPTAFGLAVAQGAREVVDRLFNLRRELHMLRNLDTGRVVIGADAHASEILLRPALSRMVTQFPRLTYTVRMGPCERQIQDLAGQTIDLFIGSPPETRDPRIHWHDVKLPPTKLVCRPGHPLLAIANPTAADCLAYPIAGGAVPPWYQSWLAEHFQTADLTRSGREFGPFIESDDSELVFHLVRTTDTLSGMHPRLAAERAAAGEIVFLSIPELEFSRTLVVAWLANRPMPPSCERLLAEILGEAATAGGKSAVASGHEPC